MNTIADRTEQNRTGEKAKPSEYSNNSVVLTRYRMMTYALQGERVFREHRFQLEGRALRERLGHLAIRLALRLQSTVQVQVDVQYI